jgi:hypothetical protein
VGPPEHPEDGFLGAADARARQQEMTVPTVAPRLHCAGLSESPDFRPHELEMCATTLNFRWLARAKEQGTKLGRRRLEDSDADKVAAIVLARRKGAGIRRIARDLGVGVGTVLRVTSGAASQ